MKTRYFDDPVSVHYRGDLDWHDAVALGVRRTDENTYDVLIVEGRNRDTDIVAWVPRSRVRVAAAAMTGPAGASN